MGLEETSYTVSESEGIVEICINAEGVSFITHPFQVILSSCDQNAGIINSINNILAL